MVWEVRLELFHSESSAKTILFVLKSYTFHEFFHLGTVSTTICGKDFDVHCKAAFALSLYHTTQSMSRLNEIEIRSPSLSFSETSCGIKAGNNRHSPSVGFTLATLEERQ